MLRLILLLRTPIARQSRKSRSRSALRTVRHAGAQITQLALGFLSLALGILLLPFLLEALGPNEVPDRLFRAADRLVPAAFGAVGVVLGDAAGGTDGDGAEFADRVGSVFFGGGVGFGLFALGLGRWGEF